MRHAVLLGFLLSTACAPGVDQAADEGGNTAAITAGQVVAGDSPYYWANLTLEQHIAALTAAGVPATDATQFTSVDDPLRDRLQTWAKRLEKAMRDVSHNTSAPSPSVLLLPSNKTFNAWSMVTFARLGATVGAQDMPLPAGQVFYMGSAAGGTNVQPFEISLDPFVHPTAWARPASFTEVWNLNPSLLPNCRLKVSQGHVLSVDRACAILQQGSADALVPATSPFLTVATDLVASIADERTMVMVMAHELGHMFRAHTSPLTLRKYDFWYDQGPTKATRPVAAADSASLGAEYRALSRSAISLDYAQGASLAVSLRLLPLMAAGYTEQLLKDAPNFQNAGMSACAGMTDWVTTYGSAYALLNNILSSQVIAPQSQQAYLALEAVFSGCTEPLHFTPGRTEASGIDNTWIATVLASTGGTFPLPADPSDGETVAAYLPRAQMAALDLATREDAFRARLNGNRIGLYTIEQEADEVAAELMIRAGFSRQDVLDAWVGFEAAIDAKMPGRDGGDSGRASSSQCAQWMKDGFVTKNADGTTTPIVMTLGDLSDNHHGDCYRLYNLWRETAAHHYASGPAQAAFDTPWSALQQHAVELTATAATLGR